MISKLKDMHVEGVLESEYLEECLQEDKQLTIFPLFYNSDRPDSIAAGIMEGKLRYLWMDLPSPSLHLRCL